MKRLITVLTIGILGLSSALAVPSQDTTKKTSASSYHAAQTTQHFKKDGTVDKRYKENKTTSVHLKKDGTPDKRYRASKKTTKTTTSSSVQQ